MPAVEPRQGISDKGGECFPLTYRRGHELRNGVRGRERAMSFRAVAKQTNRRRNARRKENER